MAHQHRKVIFDADALRYVEAGGSILEFVDQYLSCSTLGLWNVLQSGKPVGVVSLRRVTELPAEQRGGRTVGDITLAAASMESWDTSESAREAIQRLGRS